MALSSHFLFLYSEHLDEAFHMKDILEMLRVADEVRIFPIIRLDGKRSPYVDVIMEQLQSMGYQAEVVKTDYEFQVDGNEMLKVIKEEYETDF